MSQDTSTSQSRVHAYTTIKAWIEDGRLGGGDALPPERELAERLSMGRRPVRWAMEQLDREGLIRRASPRTRVVVGPAGVQGEANEPSGQGILSGAVVVLSGEQLPGEEKRSDYAGGWQMHVIYAAMSAVRAHQRHLLKLNTCLLPMAEILELRDAGIAGVVVPSFLDPEGSRRTMLDHLHRLNVRCVVETDSPGDDRFHQVLPDHEGGAYELTRLLIERGRRRIVHLTSTKPVWWAEARLVGYRRAMREAGLEPLPPQPVPRSDDWAAKRGDAETFARVARHNAGYLVDRLAATSEPADAVMCLSDESVSFVAAGCRLCGRVPGEDVLLTGFDNYWHQSWGRAFEPVAPLATVDKNNAEIGRVMVETLLRGDAIPTRTIGAGRLIRLVS